MIALALATLALVSAPVDACAPLAPVTPDLAAARVYRGIGEAERDRGAASTAAVAFRAAAERDPGDAASRAALARLCAQSTEDPFAQGVARLEAGDARRALEAFRSARDGGVRSPALSLLEGICHVELGQDREAEALLHAAESSPAHREAARLFLGVLRLRAGDAAGAAALFGAAAEAPALARVARDLGRLVRADARFVVSLLAEAGWDSNATLVPASEPAAEDDGFGGLSAAVLWRPRGPTGPYVRGAGGFTQQVSVDGLDFVAVDGAAGWQHVRRAFSLAGEYDYGTRRLGGAPYLDAHRLLASAVFGSRTSLSTLYSARFERYAGAYRDYSGTVHRAEVTLGLPVGRTARLFLGYDGARDLARASDLSYLEHGPRAELRVAVGSRVRLSLRAGAAFRGYDEAGEGVGAVREDMVLEAGALSEVDLRAGFTARLSVRGVRARSSLDAFEYDKLVPALGVLWVAGF